MIINADALSAVNEYLERVFLDNEQSDVVIKDMLQQNKLSKYEIILLTKVPYQKRVVAVKQVGGNIITFADIFTGLINDKKMKDTVTSTSLADIDIGKLVHNNVLYRYVSFTPINVVGKTTVIGVELNIQTKKGFVEPIMFIFDIEQKTVPLVEIDYVFKALDLNVDGDPRKNLKAVLSTYAPHIVGQEHAKTALLLSATGSGPYDNEDVRYTINGIIIGEASTGKTQLGNELCKSLPRCALVDATASTETTMIAAYDTSLKEITLGPIALLDGDAYNFGIAIINEAQNLKEPDKLRPALEEQVVSVHKGAQHIDVKTRTSVILLMNPTMNTWDVSNFMSNFPKKFDVPFLSRFDYVIVVYPPHGEEEITEVSRAIRERHRGLKTDYGALWAVIRYARTLNPTEQSGVEKYIDDKIVELYNKYKEREIPFLPRTIEALLRMTRAFAKLTLQTKITREFVDFVVDNIIDWINIMSNPALGMIAVGSDKKNAMFLLEKVMKTDCIKETGGCSLADLARKFEELFNQTPGGEEQLQKLLDRKGLASVNTYVEFLIHNLYNEGFIYKCGVDKYCVVNSR